MFIKFKQGSILIHFLELHAAERISFIKLYIVVKFSVF